MSNSFSESMGCLGWGLLLVLILALAIFAVPALEMWLWNIIVVVKFGLPTFTFWEMFGFNLLCGLLFRPSVTVNGKK